MWRYFTVATNTLTDEQSKALVEAWRPYPWWHHLPNFWLIKDSTGALSAVALRDKVMSAAPGVRAMVLEITPKDWAGVFPNEGPVRDWLRSTWPPEAP